MRLEHRLDLGRRDVLAAADDRVGLAAAHPQTPLLVERAEVARVQPAVGGARAGGDGRATHEDLPSAAIATLVQNSGGPALVAGAPARASASGVVVTCEQLSVRP